MKDKIILLKETEGFKFGELIETFENVKGGIAINEKFIPSSYILRLNEKLDQSEERRVKELIRQQLRSFLWNLYSKQSILLQ